MAIVKQRTEWWNARVGDVLQPNPDRFVRIAAIDWDGTMWDAQGNPWRSIHGDVYLLRPDDEFSQEYLDLLMYSYERHCPVIDVVDTEGRQLTWR
jgi:hypothetical protein